MGLRERFNLEKAIRDLEAAELWLRNVDPKKADPAKIAEVWRLVDKIKAKVKR